MRPGKGEGAAVAGDGAEDVGVAEAQGQGAVAAHRQAVDGAALARGDGAIGGVDVADQVLDDGVVPGVLAVGVGLAQLTYQELPPSAMTTIMSWRRAYFGTCIFAQLV